MTLGEPIKDFRREIYNPWWARQLGLRLDWQSKREHRQRTYHSDGRGVELVVGRRGNRWSLERAVWPESTLLHAACPLLSIFWKVGPGREPPAGEMAISWGFAILDGQLHLHWGAKLKIISLNPFHWDGCTFELLRLDGVWDATRPYTPEGKDIQWYEESHPYAVASIPDYVPGHHEGPKVVIREWHAISTCRVERTTRTRKWLKWWKRVEYHVAFSLNDEVGKGKGSWKGGTVGFSEEMLSGDDVAAVVSRACAKGRGR